MSYFNNSILDNLADKEIKKLYEHLLQAEKDENEYLECIKHKITFVKTYKFKKLFEPSFFL